MKKWIIPLLLSIPFARAHCPLCTAGAVVAASGAAALGVKGSVIGLFIGAFAVSMGWWISTVLKKQYVPGQRTLLVALSYLSTILPLLPLLSETNAIYLSWMGTYGTTIPINGFLVGSVVGGVVVCTTPWMSKKITELRNKTVPYQGIMLTFGLLFVFSVIIQVVIQ